METPDGEGRGGMIEAKRYRDHMWKGRKYSG